MASQNYPQDKTEKVVAIVDGISFKNELGGAKHPQFIELDIVRDADRLDAIGAVGKRKYIQSNNLKNLTNVSIKVLVAPSAMPADLLRLCTTLILSRA